MKTSILYSFKENNRGTEKKRGLRAGKRLTDCPVLFKLGEKGLTQRGEISIIFTANCAYSFSKILAGGIILHEETEEIPGSRMSRLPGLRHCQGAGDRRGEGDAFRPSRRRSVPCHPGQGLSARGSADVADRLRQSSASVRKREIYLVKELFNESEI